MNRMKSMYNALNQASYRHWLRCYTNNLYSKDDNALLIKISKDRLEHDIIYILRKYNSPLTVDMIMALKYF